jgi:hypothetical protein
MRMMCRKYFNVMAISSSRHEESHFMLCDTILILECTEKSLLSCKSSRLGIGLIQAKPVTYIFHSSVSHFAASLLPALSHHYSPTSACGKRARSFSAVRICMRPGVIGIQRGNGRSPNWRLPNEAITVPMKMHIPVAYAWVKERNLFISLGVDAFNTVGLVQIAAPTGLGEIVELRLSATR